MKHNHKILSIAFVLVAGLGMTTTALAQPSGDYGEYAVTDQVSEFNLSSDYQHIDFLADSGFSDYTQTVDVEFLNNGQVVAHYSGDRSPSYMVVDTSTSSPTVDQIAVYPQNDSTSSTTQEDTLNQLNGFDFYYSLSSGDPTVTSNFDSSIAFDNLTYSNEATTDTTPPSITDINVEAEGSDQKVTNGENITVSANITDNESGVQNARLFWEFQEVGTTYKMTDEDGDGIYTTTIQADNGEAPDTFKIDAVDTEGNKDSVTGISNPISFEQPDLIDSFVVDQRVDGTIEETVNLMPDYDYNDGTVTYYYEKRVVVRNNQTIDEGNWERIDFNSSTDGTQEVSKDILVGIDRVAEQTGEYSVRKEIFKANATYNWDEDGDGILDTNQEWSSYDTERVDTVSYEFEVASADEPTSPITELNNLFNNIIDSITSSISDLFDSEPTAVPQPDNPPTPSNQ